MPGSSYLGHQLRPFIPRPQKTPLVQPKQKLLQSKRPQLDSRHQKDQSNTYNFLPTILFKKSSCFTGRKPQYYSQLSGFPKPTCPLRFPETSARPSRCPRFHELLPKKNSPGFLKPPGGAGVDVILIFKKKKSSGLASASAAAFKASSTDGSA